MNRWLISVPVWGERCVEVFCATALPALEAAVSELIQGYSVDVRLVVHTDQPRRISDGATRLAVEAKALPAGGRDFDIMSQAHREVMAMGCYNDRICLLTADLVLSALALRRCERIFRDDASKFMVTCASVRAVEQGRVPIGADATVLMRWAWEHRHPMTEACIWPHGQSQDLSRIYFENDQGSVVNRVCLPHPLAVRIDGRPLRFNPTIDANLINNFSPAELHMETQTGSLAMVELSPINKAFDASAGRMDERYDAGHIIFPGGVQRWAVQHKVVLIDRGGDLNCGDDDLIQRLAGGPI